MWLVKIDEGVTQGDAFGGPPQATRGGDGRDSEGIYV